MGPDKQYIYTRDDKQKQLREFIRCVEVLCDYLPDCEGFSSKVDTFRAYQRMAMELSRKNFNQSDFTELSLSVKSIINLHKEWIPPLKETNSGWGVPAYYPKLEELHEKVMKAAFELRAIGKY